ELGVEREENGRVVLAGPDVNLTGTRKQPLSGKRAWVAIRPEEATLVDDAPIGNAIAGKVTNVEFCGRDCLVDLMTAGGTLLHVRSVRQPALGESVRVYVPVERALVYPAD